MSNGIAAAIFTAVVSTCMKSKEVGWRQVDFVRHVPFLVGHCRQRALLRQRQGWWFLMSTVRLPLDLGLTIWFHIHMNQFRNDPSILKINLGIGSYSTEEGKPYVLNVVQETSKEMVEDSTLNKEYLPITGDPEFVKLSQKLILGDDSRALADGRVAGVQSVSGTGALRLLCEFIAVSLPGTKVLLSDPTWENHAEILSASKVPSGTYRYWNEATRSLDLEGLKEDIRNAPDQSVIMLHACAHNPTGVDPTKDQWREIAALMKEKNHFAFFDSAYQGFATGDLANDSWAVRYFAEQNFEMFIAQSFSKNLGLYGERVGCASVVCKDKTVAQAIASQIALIIRPMYSNPPKHGMLIAKRVLSNPAMFKQWNEELKLMSGRIMRMRTALYDELVKLKTPSPTGDWKHIITQIGMFSYTGLTVAQVNRIVKEHHVYMLDSGRISMAGLTLDRAPYLAKAIHDVVTK